MINIYKPTSKNTGSACQIWYSKSQQAFFVEILKQHSWNDQKKVASFKDSKNNPQKRAIIKLNIVEACGILNSIDKETNFTNYHNSDVSDFKSQILFEKYLREGEFIGYSLKIIRSNKQDSTPAGKASFSIGFNFNELRMLKEYLTVGLSEIFKYEKPKEEGKNFQKQNPNQSPEQDKVSEEDVAF